MNFSKKPKESKSMITSELLDIYNVLCLSDDPIYTAKERIQDLICKINK